MTATEPRRRRFADDRKGAMVETCTMLAAITSRDGTPEKESSYTSIWIADAGSDRFVVAKETRLLNGPVRRLWKRFRGAANVRRFLGDGAMSRRVLRLAGLLGGSR